MPKFDPTSYDEIMRDERMFKTVKQYQETALICKTGNYKYTDVQASGMQRHGTRVYQCSSCHYFHTY